MTSIIDSISVCITFSIAILLLLTYAQKRKSEQLSRFRGLMGWIFLWLVFNLVLKISHNHTVVLYSLRATFFTSTIMVYALMRFSLCFPEKIAPRSRLLEPIMRILMFIIGIISISDFVVDDYSLKGTLVLAQYHSGYYAYLAYIAFVYTLIIYFLLTQYRLSSRLKRLQSKFLFVGAITSMIAISTIDLLIPLITHSNTAANFGPYGIIFLVVCAFIAITRHHLFETKVLLSELWAFLLIIIILVWLFVNFSLGNLFGFLLVLSICTLFIKSVLSEAEKEEKLEKANNQLAKDKERLIEVDKLKDDFISMASHELNTPISAIKGYLSMVLVEKLGGEIPEKAQGYLETVFQSAQRLSAMVNDLLNVSRIESGRIHLIWEQTSIVDVIKQAITEVASKAEEAHHTLTFVKQNQHVPLTWFDNNRITEVIINLLGNAIKYTPPGGKISVTVGCEANSIVVSVEDNGKGIPEDKADRVFKKFSQVDIAHDEHKGTGLGMYISKKFIELHSGKIWFHSDGEGKGTTFYFSLPILAQKPYDPHEGEGTVLK